MNCSWNILFCKVQWVNWMKYANNIVITPETSYADIIVPTADTVRMSFLLDMLLSNKKPVCRIQIYCVM